MKELFGRSTERARLEGWLSSSNEPLFVVHGLPGTGKTHLLREVARACGAPLLSCEEHTSLGHLLEGLEGAPIGVIDGIEHLADTWASVLTDWCQDHPTRLLVSTQRPVPDELDAAVLELGPLSAEAAEQMWRARLRRTRPDLSVESTQGLLAIQEGHPGLIEVATQHLSIMSPEELTMELSQSPGMLLYTPSGQALWESVERIWSGLSEPARHLLVELSGLPRAFTFMYARHTSALPSEWVMPAMMELRAHHMVDLDPNHPGQLQLPPLMRHTLDRWSGHEATERAEAATRRFLSLLLERLEPVLASSPHALNSRRVPGMQWLAEHEAGLHFAIEAAERLGQLDAWYLLRCGAIALRVSGDTSQESARDPIPIDPAHATLPGFWEYHWLQAKSLRGGAIRAFLETMSPLLTHAPSAQEAHEYQIFEAIALLVEGAYDACMESCRSLEGVDPEMRPTSAFARDHIYLLARRLSHAPLTEDIAAFVRLLRLAESAAPLKGTVSLVRGNLVTALCKEKRYVEAWQHLEGDLPDPPDRQDLELLQQRIHLCALSRQWPQQTRDLRVFEAHGAIYHEQRHACHLARSKVLRALLQDDPEAATEHHEAFLQMLRSWAIPSAYEEHWPVVAQYAIFAYEALGLASDVQELLDAFSPDGVMHVYGSHLSDHLDAVRVLRGELEPPSAFLGALCALTGATALAPEDTLGRLEDAPIRQALRTIQAWSRDERFLAGGLGTPSFVNDLPQELAFRAARHKLEASRRATLDACLSQAVDVIASASFLWHQDEDTWYGLGQRAQLVHLTRLLITTHIAHPGAPVSLQTLSQELWPEERITTSSLKRRVQTLVSTLRQQGLQDAIIHTPSGYHVRPSLRVVWIPETPSSPISRGGARVRRAP